MVIIVIRQTILAFGLVLTYDQLEAKRIDDIITILFLLYKTDRFCVALRLFRN